MTGEYDLQRFIDAQEGVYEKALVEIKNGRKQTHWMWFVFPQIKGLGYSETAKFFAIQNLEEATQYLDNETLGNRLIEIANALIQVKDRTANQIFGSPDDAKLKSCMTLFSLLKDTDDVFDAVLQSYFSGQKDQKTLQIIKNSN